MSDMALKLQTLWPELLLTAVAFTVMILGLSRNLESRRATYWLSQAALIMAAVLALVTPSLTGIATEGDGPTFATFAKVSICLVGVLMLLAMAELPGESGNDRDDGKGFDPADVTRGEFFGFTLLSLVGAMLCAGADDLIWLFLALELTSLPTYVMVATSRPDIRAPEAAVKYFFLGAMAAAVFLYGFAMLYGAAGSTLLSDISAHFATHGIGPIGAAGLILSVIGLCFKIAAVPMHFYAADVYQGAATPVTAFLAFTPKAAGFLSLILIVQTAGWPLELNSPALFATLWIIAVATMFVGNTIALLQTNVKRMLAYSSVAHSGYMIVGLLAGPGLAATAAGDSSGSLARNGLAAVLFYLIGYGVMNLGAFAVLGMIKRNGEEADTIDDLRGLAKRRPALAAVMAICVLSLMGIPPLIGFWGKLYLITAAVGVGSPAMITLAVLTVIASAIGAFYYLRIIGACYLAEPDERTEIATLPQRQFAAILAAVGVVALSLPIAPQLMIVSNAAARNAITAPTPAAASAPTDTNPQTEHPALQSEIEAEPTAQLVPGSPQQSAPANPAASLTPGA